MWYIRLFVHITITKTNVYQKTFEFNWPQSREGAAQNSCTKSNLDSSCKSHQQCNFQLFRTSCVNYYCSIIFSIAQNVELFFSLDAQYTIVGQICELHTVVMKCTKYLFQRMTLAFILNAFISYKYILSLTQGISSKKQKYTLCTTSNM